MHVVSISRSHFLQKITKDDIDHRDISKVYIIIGSGNCFRMFSTTLPKPKPPQYRHWTLHYDDMIQNTVVFFQELYLHDDAM